MTKFGIRHYPQTGTYLAFKDTLFLGIVLWRDWITNEGTAANKQSRVSVCMQLSKEGAIGNIRKYFQTQQAVNYPCTDEYVHEEEWWDK